MTTVTKNPIADTFVISYFPDDNFGGRTDIQVRDRDISTAYSLVKFDLSDLQGVKITSAKLRLYYYDYDGTDPAGKTVDVHAITEEWGEMEVTWNTKPSYDETIYAQFEMPSSYGWIEVDITTLVQEWVNGTRTNYGLLLKFHTIPVDNYSYVRFNSREADSNNPELVIEYIYEEALAVSTTPSTSLSRTATLSRTLAVSSLPSSTLSAKSIITRALAVSTTTSVDVSRVATLSRTLTVSTTASVDLSRVLAAIRTLPISVTTSSSIAAKKVVVRELSISTPVTPSLERILTATRTLTIPVSISPTLYGRKIIKVCGLEDFTISTNIRAQTIDTIAVNIAAQSLGNVDVNLAASSITLDVNITNAVLDVNITNATLDVNVTNTSLNVNVTNSTLDVNITNTDVGVTINSSNVVLDINAAGGTLDNVNYSDAILKSNCFEGAIGRGDFSGSKLTFASVPSGYVFYLVGATLTVENADTSVVKRGWLGVYNPCVGVEQIIAEIKVPPGDARSVDISLATPVKIPYGGYFFVQADTNAAATGTVRVVLVSASLDNEGLKSVIERGTLMSIRYPPIDSMDNYVLSDNRQHRPERVVQTPTA